MVYIGLMWLGLPDKIQNYIILNLKLSAIESRVILMYSSMLTDVR